MNKTHHHILVSIKYSKKIINIQYTKYPVIKEVTTQMHFQQSTDFYTFLWTDQPLTIKEIRDLPSQVKVNHFPEIQTLTRKNKLAHALNTMQRYFPREYDFFPETYNLPTDFNLLLKKHSKGKFYIVKPQNGCQGKGIFLTNNPMKLQKSNQMIVQRYITNPMLIDGLKFDLRIYVLVTCIQPLRIFIYQDGLARFSTKAFQTPNESNLDDLYQHLTNYAINKNNQNFTVDEQNFAKGHKRLLSTMFSQQILNAMFEKISDLVVKSIISVAPIMQNAFNLTKRDNPNSCFQLLGFDFLITETMKFKLIEINQNPSLLTETGVDKKIKKELVQTVFEMVEIPIGVSDDKSEGLIKMKDKHELQKCGNFKRIYPSDDLQKTEKYDPFISKSRQLFRDKFGINIVRSIPKNPSQITKIQQWNESSENSNNRLERVYGGRSTKTSHRKRLIFL